MNAHEFLKALNAKLDPAAATEGKSGAAAAGGTKKAVAAARGAVFGRVSGLQRMTVFGLKYCQISKKTVGLLEVCYVLFYLKLNVTVSLFAN